MREERETSLPIDVDCKHAFWVGFNGVMEKAAGYIGVVAECVCVCVCACAHAGFNTKCAEKRERKKIREF